MILNIILKKLKSNTINILIPSLLVGMMVIGSCATVSHATLQDHTICISTGQRLTWGHRISGMPTESSITFGKHARLIADVMECATSKTDGLALASWRLQKLLTLLQHQGTRDLEYYLSQDPC